MVSKTISNQRRFCILVFTLLCTVASFSQTLKKERLNVFIDCSNSYCDMNFIKTEITLVNYVLDFKAADVHVLITQQNTGGGGSQYQMIFYGQNNFKDQKDTLRFDTKPNSTDFENRNLLIKYLRLGLVPYLVQTAGIENINIELKQSVTGDSLSKAAPTKDPWNYWVFNINTNGNLSADQVYKGFRYSGNLSATRITEQLKIRFSISGSKNKTIYEFEDASSGITKIEVKNNTYSFFQQTVKSLSNHWSLGYDVNVLRSTFTNYKFRTVLKPAIEYNFFPYQEVNNKYFTIRYGIDFAHNQYFDTTLYLKTEETLIGQGLNADLAINQKWGTINLSANTHSYFNNPKYYNVGLGGGVNVRVTGNLSFNVFVFGSYQRDQLYLPKGEATIQQVLTRQRQLATNYNYYTFFGVSYRFGSKLNNFVNPRFEGGGNFFFD
ncbi:MAG TPA: hypothetical protein VMY77_15505 [Chitinophagaceae bacterium]|nr:hypothetical protein [Chitinophagaceae bacterium]